MTVSLRRLVAAAGLAGLVLSAVVALPPAQAAPPQVTVASYDFEAGTTQGWFARGGATVAPTAQAAHGGAAGLHTTGRTQGWEGPSVELAGALRSGSTYRVSAFVRLAPGSPAAAVQLTMQRRPAAGGAVAYEFVTRADAVDSGWVQLTGSYTVPSPSDQLQLYLESPDPTVSFDVDDVLVTTASDGSTGGVTSDFEDGTTQGWRPRIGPEKVAVTDSAAHGGRYSVLVADRTETWTGAALNLLPTVTKGKQYELSVWVRLAPWQADASLQLMMERRSDGAPSYESVSPPTRVTASGWVELSGTYLRVTDAEFLTAYVESPGSRPDFLIDDFTLAEASVAPEPIETDIPSLRDVLAPYFKIGAGILTADTLGGTGDLLAKHFDSITPGNALKWDATEPTEGRFSFADADVIVDFAQRHDQALRGHTLLWHSQTPGWVFRDAAGADLTATPDDKALLLRRLEHHIRGVLGRYKGQMYAWDVVNEVVDEHQPDGMRRSRWFEITGYDYLRTAFRVAREVDPDTKLFVNDYNTEQPAKRDALYRLVRMLRAEGVPIDGVGHQFHVNLERPDAANVEATVRTFGELGLDNHITELDMSVYTNFVDNYADSGGIPAAVLTEQGYRFQEIFDALRRQHRYISSVTQWGVTDRSTWLDTFPIPRIEAPEIFDRQLRAKPAYWGIVDPTRLPARTRTLATPAGRPGALQWSLLPASMAIAPRGLAAGVRARWDARRVYVRVDVRDATRDRGDVAQLRLGAATYRITRAGTSTPRVPVTVHDTPAGYRVVAALPAPQRLSAGGSLPFDVRVTDARGAGEAVSWNNVTSAGQGTGRLDLQPAVGQVDAVRGTPVVDGAVDPMWARAPRTTTAVRVAGSGPAATATARLTWDDRTLYVLAEVADSTPDASSSDPAQQDSVEFFVDPGNAKTRGYLDHDGRYRVSSANTRTVSGNFGGYVIAGNLTSATRTVPGGYVVEAAIACNDVCPDASGLTGFDLQVTDAAGGTRSGVVGWNDPTGRSFVDTSRWGVVRFVTGPR